MSYLGNKDKNMIVDGEYENKRVKCVVCDKDIHIDDFGGITQKGTYCSSITCLEAISLEPPSRID